MNCQTVYRDNLSDYFGMNDVSFLYQHNLYVE